VRPHDLQLVFAWSASQVTYEDAAELVELVDGTGAGAGAGQGRGNARLRRAKGYPRRVETIVEAWPHPAQLDVRADAPNQLSLEQLSAVAEAKHVRAGAQAALALDRELERTVRHPVDREGDGAELGVVGADERGVRQRLGVAVHARERQLGHGAATQPDTELLGDRGGAVPLDIDHRRMAGHARLDPGLGGICRAKQGQGEQGGEMSSQDIHQTTCAYLGRHKRPKFRILRTYLTPKSLSAPLA
jgi:hypothetical protein